MSQGHADGGVEAPGARRSDERGPASLEEGRTDLILTAEGPVFLEVNTLPGLTKASFIPQQLAGAGRRLDDFLAWQLELARRRYD